jgi:hypothetical protein
MGSEEVANALASDSLVDYSSYFNSLFARNSKVLIYAGEFDTQDGPLSCEPWLRRLDIPDSKEFWEQARNIYYLSDNTTGGYYRQNSVFSFLTVPKAGHFVPNSINNYKVSF